MNPELSMLNATLLGYVAGLAWGESPKGAERNPYAYIQPEAFQWQFGFEQGRDRRNQCGVFDPIPPEPLQMLPIMCGGDPIGSAIGHSGDAAKRYSEHLASLGLGNLWPKPHFH